MNLQEKAQCAVHALDTYYQEVTLVPAPVPQYEGHMVRLPTNKNPTWYEEIYIRSGRHSRKRITGYIKRIANGESLKGSFQKWLAKYINNIEFDYPLETFMEEFEPLEDDEEI